MRSAGQNGVQEIVLKVDIAWNTGMLGTEKERKRDRKAAAILHRGIERLAPQKGCLAFPSVAGFTSQLIGAAVSQGMLDFLGFESWNHAPMLRLHQHSRQ